MRKKQLKAVKIGSADCYLRGIFSTNTKQPCKLHFKNLINLETQQSKQNCTVQLCKASQNMNNLAKKFFNTAFDSSILKTSYLIIVWKALNCNQLLPMQVVISTKVNLFMGSLTRHQLYFALLENTVKNKHQHHI